ncbi:M14 family metallopeptidase [Roseisolibacter agri]|uniref:Deacylase/carboxypeptidase superfamily protein n=1 Tax=Roseisolibacter agri TaxID=2014610 RepID=A0AA37VC01_9BACT|nr:M14 family metallopeptidase [Roseisolibacter agri]GLC27118.1 deacylase/carboxypeptidase superfamily protein [Roseisolibacter agri]
MPLRRPGRPAVAALLALSAALASRPAVLAAQPPIGAAVRDSLRDDRAFSFEARGPYRPAVPRPEALLGYRLGDRNTQYAEQERVLLAIAAAAPERVRVEEIGATHEGRRMRLFVASSPENIARLDEIRRDLDRIADPRAGSAAEIDALAARTPAVVWISESVHGNESPGFESGMQLLYQLAASDEPATVAALRNAIVVLNPSSNPDGHERFSVWYNSVARRDPANQSFEHDEPWSIQGRFNHYRFDLNRDVIASTQPEVQAIMRGMLRWHPQVAVDQHGQVSTYFFPPAARPVNEHIGAESEKWLTRIGRANAAAFDRYGWQYYVRSYFDLYYPGYWDTWPSLTGATGMTYETDGGGWKGLLWEREDGSKLSFRDGIAKHWVSAMSTVEATAAGARERVADYLAFRRRAVEDGRAGRVRRYAFSSERDPLRAAELAAALLRAGIEVRRADAPFQSARAHAYGQGTAAGDAAAARRFGAGTYVVDLAQPQGRLARAILEPAPVLDPEFQRLQEQRFARNQRRGSAGFKEQYEFYDITAWSLPVAFGVEAWWTEDAAPVTGALLALPDAGRPGPALASATAGAAAPIALTGPAASTFSEASPGSELLAAPLGGGVTGGTRAQSAYVFGPERTNASRLAWQLLAHGVRVTVVTDSTEAGGRLWPRGTFVVRTSRNDTTVHALVDRLAREAGVEVTPVASAFTERAKLGIGAEQVVALKRPRVAVVGDEGVSQTAFGALWWTLDRRYGVDFTHLNWRSMPGALSRFDVVVLPDAYGVGDFVGKDAVDRLKAWVRAGGTLVAMGNAAAWAAREDVGLTTARRVGEDAKPDTAGKADSARAARARADTSAEARELLAATSPGATPDAAEWLPGSHFDVVLDRTHWLTYGYEQPRLTALVTGDSFFRLSRDGSNVAVFPARGPMHRAGFQWPGNTERLMRNAALVLEEPLGGGHVVLFGNDPTFRGWWRAWDRMVLNALLLGPSF